MSSIPIVAVTGYFDPFHDIHLDYFKQAIELRGHLLCIVGSDQQLLMKKGRFNISEGARQEIVDLILRGLNVDHETVLNTFDTNSTLIAKALETLHPNVLVRGGDKCAEDLPDAEREVCNRLHIAVLHTRFRTNRHGSGMTTWV